MVYHGVSDLLQSEVVRAALAANPLIRQVLIAELVEKLRGFVALDDDQAIVLRGVLEEDEATELLAVYGVDEAGVGTLFARLKVTLAAFTNGLPSDRQVDKAVTALEAVVHSVQVEVPGVRGILDKEANPPTAISLEEAEVERDASIERAYRLTQLLRLSAE